MRVPAEEVEGRCKHGRVLRVLGWGLNRVPKLSTVPCGRFANDRSVVRLVGALMLEQCDEWAVSRRYMSLESLAALSDAPFLRLSAVAA